MAPPATRLAAVFRVGSTWYWRILASVGPSSAATIAAALLKPSRVASVVKAASVGAKTVRLALPSASAGTSPALSAAATRALKPASVASCASVPGSGSSSLPPQAVTANTTASAAALLNQSIMGTAPVEVEKRQARGRRRRAVGAMPQTVETEFIPYGIQYRLYGHFMNNTDHSGLEGTPVARADYNPPMAKLSFRQQVLQVREDAIVSSVNRLLAEKGFDLMTVDEVAADVGIAKASLYKHFTSKEELAAAAMIRVLDRALVFLDGLSNDVQASPLAQLKAVARWTMQVQLAGEMPSLPAQNSSLRATLMTNKVYLDRLMEVSDRLGGWITAAQQRGEFDPALPGEVVLYTLYARACDPVLGLLKLGGQYSDEKIIELLLTTCFEGLRARA